MPSAEGTRIDHHRIERKTAVTENSDDALITFIFLEANTTEGYRKPNRGEINVMHPLTARANNSPSKSIDREGFGKDRDVWPNYPTAPKNPSIFPTILAAGVPREQGASTPEKRRFENKRSFVSPTARLTFLPTGVSEGRPLTKARPPRERTWNRKLKNQARDRKSNNKTFGIACGISGSTSVPANRQT